MNLFYFHNGQMSSVALDLLVPVQPNGFYWLSLARQEIPEQLPMLQQWAARLGGGPMLDLHCNDLQSVQHPSHYDYTSVYDLLIFRRLHLVSPVTQAKARDDPSTVFASVATEAVSFVLYDRLLVSVHPTGCHAAHSMVERFLEVDPRNTEQSGLQSRDLPTNGRTRQPLSPADLTLRMIDLMVDDFLALRKDLSVGLEGWLNELLKTNPKIKEWTGLMSARNQLQNLEAICQDQQEALEEWMTSAGQDVGPGLTAAEHDGVMARGRDVVEHIKRVVQHVHRLEASAESSVQIYFGAQSHRANNIMKTLTALTAVFLPLNLITGFFGMNFDFLPLVHREEGLWWAVGVMSVVALTLVLYFWRKRYLARSSH